MTEPYFKNEYVTLYHGDCRELLASVPPVDLVLTDPPYGVTYVSNRTAGRGVKPITNDGTRLSLALYRTVFPLLRAGHILWFTRWDAWPDVWAEMGQRFPLRGLLIWDKGSPGMGDLAHWGMSYEMIASAGTAKISGSRDSSILRHNAPSPTARLHPTEKPQSLLRYLIDKVNPEAVLDPFAGSGSTLLAASSQGRRSVGIEIEERNCEIIARRFDQGCFNFGEAS